MKKTIERPHAVTAAELIKAIKTIAKKENNLENFELYLSIHFSEWLEKYAKTPDGLTYELKAFAEMEV